jgi:gliding motility-associated-like protein
MNGAVNIPVDTDISWNQVANVPGYILSLGTTPGGTDLLNEQFVGSATTYNPPLGLPENTTIYVTLALFDFQNGNTRIYCNSESFRTSSITEIPSCAQIVVPTDGQTDVNPATNIRWGYVPQATGYRLSLGTSPGGNEILNNEIIADALTYNPPADLPANTTIYVRLTAFNAIGDALSCFDFSFSTSEVAPLPGCTTMIYPANGETNVPLTPILEWNPVPGATGYRISIGTSPFTADVVNNVPFTQVTQTGILNLDANQTFFITVIPFNEAGSAIGCGQESFTTSQGCGPFYDFLSGELTTLNPDIDFPPVIATCEDQFPLVLTSQDPADGYRWFRIDANGNESLISDTDTVSLEQTGEYRYEAYILIPQSGNTECPSSQYFRVVSSEAPEITRIDIREQANGLRITVNVSGSGDYEYAIDNENGPYQQSNLFVNIPYGTRTIFVRDRNGCGIAQEQIVQDLTVEGFPKFFSPNGDGVNDLWQYIPPESGGEITLVSIEIYDRYGQFLVSINPDSRGWDGTINGNSLPASDYWFRARSSTNKEVSGHFSLTR